MVDTGSSDHGRPVPREWGRWGGWTPGRRTTGDLFRTPTGRWGPTDGSRIQGPPFTGYDTTPTSPHPSLPTRDPGENHDKDRGRVRGTVRVTRSRQPESNGTPPPTKGSRQIGSFSRGPLRRCEEEIRSQRDKPVRLGTPSIVWGPTRLEPTRVSSDEGVRVVFTDVTWLFRLRFPKPEEQLVGTFPPWNGRLSPLSDRLPRTVSVTDCRRRSGPRVLSP